MIIDNMA